MADLNEAQIKAFAAEWYRLLDIHADAKDLVVFLAIPGLDMMFPGAPITDEASFRLWYEGKDGPGGLDGVINIFFDEVHNVVSVDSKINGDTAELLVVVAWAASWFERGAAKSKRTSMNATQTWTVRRSDRNRFGLEITKYNATAKPFEFAPGFAQF